MNTRSLIFACCFTLASFAAQATPELQLGISYGRYDAGSETIITSDDQFTLNTFALAQGEKALSAEDTVYVSVTVTADAGMDYRNFGSFAFNGTVYTASDLVLGVPPLESNMGPDSNDLSTHGHFPGMFLQYPFKFSATNLTGDIDTRNNPGYLPTLNGDRYLFNSFQVKVAGLHAGYNLHFDLYTTTDEDDGDVGIALSAPFSHDAETNYMPDFLTSALFIPVKQQDNRIENAIRDDQFATVPEPAVWLLFVLGLTGVAISRKNILAGQ